MNSIVKIVENEPRVSHRVIAENTDNEDKNVRKLIDKHIDSLKLFGQLSFEMTTVTNSAGAKNNQKTYYLNEQQATLLITFMRNSQKVIEFKIALVKAFYEMKDLVCNTEPYWLRIIDLSSKKVRDAFYRAFDGKCYYSGALLNRDGFHIDHIMPKSRGGQNSVMNLVLCDPKVNQSKLNSYDEEFVRKHQEVVKNRYAPKVLAYIDTQDEKIVNDNLSDGQLATFLNPKTMDKIFEKFGDEEGRKFYSKIITGMDYKEIKIQTKNSVAEFAKNCIKLKSDNWIGTMEILSVYKRWCIDNDFIPLKDFTFNKEIKKRLGIESTLKRFADGTNKRCLEVELVI
jgi:hypothetical protein